LFLTVNEVAEFLKVSVQTIRRFTMNGEIPFHKIKRMVRYDKFEIEEWAKTGTISDFTKNKTVCDENAE